MSKRKGHVCPNRFHAEGARGGAYIEVDEYECPEGHIRLDVGWSCVVVHSDNVPVPVTWIAEVIAIATAHKGGIAGFLAEQGYGGGESWALAVDPPPK